MTSKERIYAVLHGRPYDRPAVTPIFMAWAARFIGRPYRDYYLDGDVLVQAQLAVVEEFNLDQIGDIIDVDWMVSLREARKLVEPNILPYAVISIRAASYYKERRTACPMRPRRVLATAAVVLS